MVTRQRRTAIISAALAAALIVAVGCATTGQKVKTGPAGGAAVTVTDIRAAGRDGQFVVTVEGSQPLTYSLFKLEDPPRLALDLPGADLGKFKKNIPVNSGPVSFIKPMPMGAEKGAAPRMEIHLTKAEAYEARAAGNLLEVIFSEGAAAGTAAAPAPAPAAVTSAPVLSPDAPSAPDPAPAPAQPAAAMPAASQPATRLVNVEVLSSPQGSQVVIEGDGRLEYEYFLVEGRSVVVDIYGVSNSIAPLSRVVTDQYVKGVRVGEHFEPRKKVRVVVDMAEPSEYKVVTAGERLLVNFGALAQETDEKLRNSLANVVTDVYFRPLEDRSVLEIAAAKDIQLQKVDSEDPNRLILEVLDSRIAPEAQKTLDLAPLGREIVKVVAFQYKKDDRSVVRVVAQFGESVPYRVDLKGNRVFVEVPRSKPAAPPAAPVVAVAAPAVSLQAPPAVIPAPVVYPAAVTVVAAPAVIPAPVAVLAAEPAAQLRQFNGRKLSLDFKDAEVTDILRLISEVSGINFATGPEVKGKVSIKMVDVPWDQALDIILKTNEPRLVQIQEADNIIRITTEERILKIRQTEVKAINEEKRAQSDMAELERKRLEAVEKSAKWTTRIMPVAYGNAGDIVDTLVKMFKGDDKVSIISDKSNKYIIAGVPRGHEEKFQVIEDTLRQLDRPTPAVQIEARIITVQNDFTRNLGIQWGFNYAADPEHGSSTGFAFPNSIGLGGTAGAEGSNYLVNLPAGGATAGVGLQLGHIADIFNLDLKLSAMETMGQVEILSNPKVLVLQNKKAVINIGSQLPVPKTDAEGNRTVEFKDVGIKLEVTPQVTADNKVFLDVQLERSRQGPDVNTSEGPQFSIETERADTKVLLGNGETSVIGGLFQQSKTNTDDSVPGLGKIPFLGWLFKSQSKSDTRRELLIFLTPKIVEPN